MGKSNFIKLAGVEKIFDDGSIAVSDINISINKGEFVTLLGPSGCGKTTILKMLAGFEMPTAGKIIVDGIDIKDLAINKRPTATVFQDYALFPNMNVLQNVCYGLKVMRKPIRGITAKERAQAKKEYDSAEKKALSEIKKIKSEQTKILKQIEKEEKIYGKYPKLVALRGMRAKQYNARIDSLIQKIRKVKGEDYEFVLSKANRFAEFKNKFTNFWFRTNKPIQYNINGLTKEEESLLNLRKWFLFKQPHDLVKDDLKYRFNDLDQWISYWLNYPNQKQEEFENKNITRKLTKNEILERAKKIIELVGLAGKETKFPGELSGGMQQRVALARALVVEPQILLLDEPLSALDAKVRQQMQQELKRLHNELGLTFILVTHDQEEALSLSNKVVVMSKGKVEQIDSPKKIYDNPANQWVANFIGKANIFDAIYIGNNQVEFQGIKTYCKDIGSKKILPNTPIKLMIRPEDIEISLNSKQSIINAKVTSVTYKGLMYEVHCVWNKNPIQIETITQVKIGESLHLSWNKEAVHLMTIKPSEVIDAKL